MDGYIRGMDGDRWIDRYSQPEVGRITRFPDGKGCGYVLVSS